MLLGDVGGFSGFLYAMGTLLMKIFKFANAENFLVNRLYRKNMSKKGEEENELDHVKQ